MYKEISTGEKVYDYIMEKIISKEWLPNMKIMTENQLAQELGVSRISVREAIEKLSAFGILTKRQGSGTVVNELKPSNFMKSLYPILTLSNNDLEEILEFRVFFEEGNVELFMKNYNEENVNKLKFYYQEMTKNYTNQEAFYLNDYLFHEEIAMGTNNPIVIAVSGILHDILKLNIKQMYFDVGPKIGLYYHKLILEAIEKKDVTLAKLLMRRHLEETLEECKKLKGLN